MPNTETAKKRMRQNAKAKLRNRIAGSTMKTAIRRVDDAVTAGDAAKLKSAVEFAYKRIDKAAKTNVIHANTAARRKSLVMRKAAKLGS
jgi:small subunit ribosomal protein S20